MPVPEVPAKLYKYREFSDRTYRIFTHRELYFPSPSQFNDPFDCRMRYSTDCTKNDFCKFVKDSSKVTEFIRLWHPEVEFEEAISLAYPKRDLLVTDAFRVEHAKLIEATGVFCLTIHNDDPLMWSHYAASHTGFCLEFSTTTEPLFQHARSVEYSVHCPVFECFNSDPTQIVQRAIFRKSPHWKYEDEWRVIGTKLARSTFQFLPGTLSGVILGSRIDSQRAKELNELCALLDPAPTIYVARLRDQEYAIDVNLES